MSEHEKMRTNYKLSVQLINELKNEYYKSGLSNEMIFTEYLKGKGYAELSELESYKEKIVENLFNKYIASNSSVSFSQFVNNNDEFKNMIDGFANNEELDSYAQSKRMSSIQR